MTTNAGSNWVSPVSALPGTANVSGITGFGTVWVVTRQATAIYLSNNNGTTWLTSYTAPAGNYRHVAKNRADNTVFYGVRSNGGISKGTYFVGVSNISNEVPSSFELKQNYPNPFNPSTIIEFSIAKNSFVTLSVFDHLGREIEKPVSGNLDAGTYSLNFDASGLASGTYYYRINTGEFSETKKMILVK